MKKYRFKIDKKEYNVKVVDVDGGMAEVEVNGKNYNIEIEETQTKVPKTPILVRKPVETPPGENKVAEKLAPMPLKAKSSAKTMHAPLPGSVLKVNVSEGDVIAEGDVLMIMESMKMENNITAEKAGKIAKVYVSVGMSVMQDDSLFDIE